MKFLYSSAIPLPPLAHLPSPSYSGGMARRIRALSSGRRGMMGLRGKEGGMAKDIVVTLENRPGQLASVGEALGGAGVNIEGICVEPQGEHHILVTDSDSTGGVKARGAV
jgi:ACT domain